MKIDKLIRIPLVAKRLEKLFPDSDLYNEGHNILLNTIRIPKNLLYLTDRLPKPRYASVNSDIKNKLNVTDGAEYPLENMLPMIPLKKIQKSKKYSRPHIGITPNKYNAYQNNDNSININNVKPQNPTSLSKNYGKQSQNSIETSLVDNDTETPKKHINSQKKKNISELNNDSPENDSNTKLKPSKIKVRIYKDVRKNPELSMIENGKIYLENLLKNNRDIKLSYLKQLSSKKFIENGSLSPISKADRIIMLHKRYFNAFYSVI
jgi:hypothetical protein